jgi:hypothetical protein
MVVKQGISVNKEMGRGQLNAAYGGLGKGFSSTIHEKRNAFCVAMFPFARIENDRLPRQARYKQRDGKLTTRLCVFLFRR